MIAVIRVYDAVGRVVQSTNNNELSYASMESPMTPSELVGVRLQIQSRACVQPCA